MAINEFSLLAKKEEKKEKIEGLFESTSLFVTVLVLFSIILVITLIYTGYLPDPKATQIPVGAGNITYVDVQVNRPTVRWAGIYGLTLRVPGFTENQSLTVTAGNIHRQDNFFDCIQSGVGGGNEIFASEETTIDFDTIVAGNYNLIDSWLNSTNAGDSANRTFTERINVTIGTTILTDVPATYTKKFDGDNDVFSLGVLNASGSVVLVSHIASVQKGFSESLTVNYQMILPVPANSTQPYNFFIDPNDECPGGGIGSTINATLFGYVTDSSQNYLSNATIFLTGYSTTSDSNGFYNLSTLVLSGNYTAIARKNGYDPFFSNVTFNFTTPSIQLNITLNSETPGSGNSVFSSSYGFVKDESSNPLSEVNISLGNVTILSASDGSYNISSYLLPGHHYLIALKGSYDNYVKNLNFTSVTSIGHNITLILANDNDGKFVTGPKVEKVKKTPKVTKGEQDFWISTTELRRKVRENTFVKESIGIYNFKDDFITVGFSLSGNITKIIELDKNTLGLSPEDFSEVTLTIFGTEPIGTYTGTLTVDGDIQSEVPVSIEIVPSKLPIDVLFMDLRLLKQVFSPNGFLEFRLGLQNLLIDQSYKVSLTYEITDESGEEVYLSKIQETEIKTTANLVEKIRLPPELSPGKYLLSVNARYLNLASSVNTKFTIGQPLIFFSVFGIPLWVILTFVFSISFTTFGYVRYKKYIAKKKRYSVPVELNKLPLPGERSIKVGKVAETNVDAYIDMDKLTTHSIVAGATGRGKSISAQVIIEELLKKGIAVVVFDPTAQWGGMLRKCEDEKMLAYYSKFGLTPKDAKAFNGNVRQILDGREVIDLKKHIKPGELQVFTMNKMDPKDIDIFASSIIKQVFSSNPKEEPELKTVLVFEEVHRLLPKFGGSGEGFIQIERACREFRKWGIGVMLVSQVLSDFVGEIQANINTEVQMRTVDEGDLGRISTKYGSEILKALVRAAVGVGMVQNSEYNRGRPYFINFRPILHNPRRLSDEELEKYNKYNEIVDDLEYQIEQLEKEGQDAFDLKLELKLILDKIKTGNFSVVEIYLEGLTPRIEKLWQKLGKKPKKKQKILVDEKELQKSLAEAKKSREAYIKKQDSDKKEKPIEEKADPFSKLVNPLTFNNGVMVSSVKELRDVLEVMDLDIFKEHVTEEKNDISSWIKDSVQLNDLSIKTKEAKSPQELIQILDSFTKKDKQTKGKKND